MPPLKHVIDNIFVGTNSSYAGGAANVTQIAIGTINPNSYTTQQQVRNGSIIKKITLQIDLMSTNTNSIDIFDWFVWFNIGGTQPRPTANLVNPSVIKNQVFHQDGCMFTVQVTSAVGVWTPRVSSWRVEINIPRSLQQINENDVIELVQQGGANASNTHMKVKVIYKEIFP